ncbi:MAG: glycosyltransferase [Chloroflexi bacterium]|nr:glycosyltransferase [Chloroflexota bacterium]
MRIAIIGNASSPNVLSWIQGLRSVGADVHLISVHSPANPDSKTHVIRMPRPLRKLAYFAAVPAARQLLQQIQPDITVGYFATGYGTLAMLTGWKPLVIVTAGSDLFVAPYRNPVIRRILRLTLRRADLVVALAPHMAEQAIRLGACSEKIFIQPHGIPLDKFGSARCAVPTEDDSLRVISTRSLKPIYNIDRLIEAVALLDDLQTAASIVGHGPLRDSLTAQVQVCGIEDRIVFTGRVSNAELPEILARHNVYVSLTDTEGVSASLLEAMAVGLTPIVRDIDANRYWITDGENGLLLPDSSPKTVADALRRVDNDMKIRQRAYEQNPTIVRERGDLSCNSVRYIQKFRQFAPT